MADMATTLSTRPGTATEITDLHAAAVAFSKAAGDKMMASDLAVTAAKAGYTAAVKAQVEAHAEATAANVVLAAADAAANGTVSHKAWYIAAAVGVACIVAAIAVHFVL